MALGRLTLTPDPGACDSPPRGLLKNYDEWVLIRDPTAKRLHPKAGGCRANARQLSLDEAFSATRHATYIRGLLVNRAPTIVMSSDWG